MRNDIEEIYHEKQVREMCALHTLNNLFQRRDTFTKLNLDAICNDLAPDHYWINPHKSIFGLGNYDINVIIRAVQDKGYETVWFDKRKDPNCLDLNVIFGFILNVPSDYKFGFLTVPLYRRHWIAIRKIHGLYYNLDSKLDGPLIIGYDMDLILFLRKELQAKDKELFLVVNQQEKWQKNNT